MDAFTDIIVRFGPLVISSCSIIYIILGHRLKSTEVISSVKTQHIDQIVKINTDLRSELERKDTVIDSQSERIKELQRQLREKQEELFEAFLKVHSRGE